MWTEVDRYIHKYDMLKDTGHIVIGLSGGADSVCLARYFIYLRSKGGPDITAVHVNHMLRGREAKRDEDFVKSFCSHWSIPLVVFHKDVGRISDEYKMTVEEAGRSVRYECFRDVMGKSADRGKVRLAVAHHADDLAETMVFRMIRGTGPRGLVAMRPVQDDIIRPFLAVRKKEILNILEELQQDYVEDSSNHETEYSRNFIRHHILPDMEQINPRAVEHLIHLSEQEYELLSCINNLTEEVAVKLIHSEEETGDLPDINPEEDRRKTVPDHHGKCYADAEALLAQPEYIRQEIIRKMYVTVSGCEKDFGRVHVDQVMELLDHTDGKRTDLPCQITAVRSEGKLVLVRKDDYNDQGCGKNESVNNKIVLPEYEEGKNWSIILDNGMVLSMKYRAYPRHQFRKGDCEKYFDYDTIKHELSLRTPRQGDYFVFDAAGRKKRLSRYFIDNKIRKEDRNSRLLLADGSHILWILGGRISAAYKITDETSRMLVISITNNR